MSELIAKIVRVLVAYFVSPLVAAPVLFGTALVLQGRSPVSAIIAPLTFHGMMITVVAAFSVLVAGTLMLLISKTFAPLQSVSVWALVGAVLGMLAGLPFVEFGIVTVLVSAGATGAACSTVFRLITGNSFGHGRSASRW